MAWWEAALLGLVQGVFMFVPVSSTSHLVLTQHGLLAAGSAMPSPDAPEMILFDLVAHVGTLVSIVIVMGGSLRRFLRGVVADLGGPPAPGRGLPPARGIPRRLFALGVLATAVTGVLGLLVRGILAPAFANPTAVAVALIVTGGMLWWTDRMGHAQRGLKDLSVPMAVAVGVAQAAALMPGISRSGFTIFTGLLFGLRRRWVAEFSFFLAIPTIAGATLVQAFEVWRTPEVRADLAALAIGFVVAAGTGAVALYAVLRLLYRARFRVFSYYVVALAVAVLLFRLPVAG